MRTPAISFKRKFELSDKNFLELARSERIGTSFRSRRLNVILIQLNQVGDVFSKRSRGQRTRIMLSMSLCVSCRPEKPIGPKPPPMPILPDGLHEFRGAHPVRCCRAGRQNPIFWNDAREAPAGAQCRALAFVSLNETDEAIVAAAISRCLSISGIECTDDCI